MNRWRVRLAVLFLCPLSLFSQTRDYWLKSERKGTAFAYEHITVTKLPDGNLRYDYLLHIKTLDPKTIVETGIYVVDPELRPISFDKRSTSEGKERRLVGTRAGNTITVTVQEENGQPVKREFSRAHVYFGVVLEELIARNAGRKRFRLQLFDTDDLAIETNRVKILKTDAREIEASVKDRNFSYRYRIARDGQVREMQEVDLGIRTYLTDAKDAQSIVYLNTPDFFTLTVRSQRTFPNVFKVSRAQVQVRWKKIPFREFRLEDNRQKVLRKRESGGEFEVVVEIARPSSRARAPAAAARKRPAAIFLGEDEYIKPRDPEIRKQARAIAGETTSPSEIVRKLLEWVSANIVYGAIAGKVSGPEVLAKKHGKCDQYAILFASLARALGVPTRLVLGEAYGDGVWGGHMWNEVWLGEWLAVDAAAGMYVAWPSHLRLVDSPTFDGALNVVPKLLDNLRIEILDFQEEKAQTSLKTGVRGSTYVNASFDCRISAPDGTWTLKEESEGGETILSMKPKEGAAEFALVFFGVPPGTTSGPILEARLADAGKSLSNYKLIEKGELEVARRKALSAVFSHNVDGGTLVHHNILLVDGSSGYLFTLTAPQHEFAGLGPVVKKILASFELVNPVEAPRAGSSRPDDR